MAPERDMMRLEAYLLFLEIGNIIGIGDVETVLSLSPEKQDNDPS